MWTSFIFCRLKVIPLVPLALQVPVPTGRGQEVSVAAMLCYSQEKDVAVALLGGKSPKL